MVRKKGMAIGWTSGSVSLWRWGRETLSLDFTGQRPNIFRHCELVGSAHTEGLWSRIWGCLSAKIDDITVAHRDEAGPRRKSCGIYRAFGNSYPSRVGAALSVLQKKKTYLLIHVGLIRLEVLSSCYKRRSWGSEKLNSLAEVRELRDRASSQVCWLQMAGC